MDFPVKCTCGKVISNRYIEYERRKNEGEIPQLILNDLKIKDWCCRRMFLSHVSLDEHLLRYQTYPGGVHRIGGPQRASAAMTAAMTFGSDDDSENESDEE